MLASRLFSSLVNCIISRLRLLSSSFNVVSSSLVDCNSSFAVSSSSLVDCSSSLLDSISSLADFNSSFVASCSSMMVCNDSLDAANSRRRSGCMFETQVRAAANLLHVHVLIDYHRRRRVGAEHDAVGHFQKVTTEVCASSGCRSGPEVREFKAALRDEVRRARRRHRHLPVDFVFLVH